MTKRFVSIVSVLALLLHPHPGAVAEEKGEEKPWAKTFTESLEGEAWPNLWIDYRTFYAIEPSPSAFSDESQEGFDKRGAEALGNAARDVVEEELKRSSSYKEVKEWLERKTGRAKVDLYQQQVEGRETPKKLTLDAGLKIMEDIDTGFRFRSSPAFYLHYNWLTMGQGKLRHDWSVYPVKNTVEHRIDGMPRWFNFRLKYNYIEEKLKFRLQDFPIYRKLTCSFSTSYDFSESAWVLQLGFYGRL